MVKYTSNMLNKEGALFIIVEPTGGKPNCYGEVEKLHLKNSGLVICYSTKYYKIIEDYEIMSLMPDILCKVTISDYIKKLDPCMLKPKQMTL